MKKKSDRSHQLLQQANIFKIKVLNIDNIIILFKNKIEFAFYFFKISIDNNYFKNG